MFGVRTIGGLIGAVFVFVLAWAFFVPRDKQEETPHGLPPLHMTWSFNQGAGIFGEYDRAQLQRGFAVYKGVCGACHSMKLVAFRDLQDIGFSEAEVKAIAKNWNYKVPTINPQTGEETERPPLPSDYFPGPFKNEIQARAANNNALPPDMSLLAKAREGGPAYIYSLVGHGYDEAARGQFKSEDGKPWETPTGLYFNKYFANLNIAMPPPLSGDGLVQYNDGTKATKEQMAKDVAAFLMWTAEPKLEARRQTGVATVGFLIVLTGLLWATYKRVWQDVKHPRGPVLEPAE